MYSVQSWDPGALGQAAGCRPYWNGAGTNRLELHRSVAGMSGGFLRDLRLACDWLVGLLPSLVWFRGGDDDQGVVALPGDQQTRLSTRLERYLAYQYHHRGDMAQPLAQATRVPASRRT